MVAERKAGLFRDESVLNHTSVRPGDLTNGEGTGRVAMSQPSPWPLWHPNRIGKAFDVLKGEQPIAPVLL